MYAAASSPFSMGTISAGALLGTAGTADLVRSINDSMGGSSMMANIHHTMRDISNSFVERVLRPIQRGREVVARQVNILMNPDVIRPLTHRTDFAAVPPCMYDAIVMFPPVRSLLEQGRISGFGYNPDHLPKEDTWGRLIDNGTIYDARNAPRDAEGRIYIDWEWRSTDPKVTDDELDAVERTRQAIAWMLSNTDLDPTDYPETRG
jgi:hypothetical protein